MKAPLAKAPAVKAAPWLLAALFLGACAPAAPATPTDLPPVEPAVSEETVLTAPPEVETAASAEPAGSDTEPANPTLAPAPTNTQNLPTATLPALVEECPFTPDLHATDPATVALASGKVQLVEFFAFW